jgi:hypothetical protein
MLNKLLTNLTRRRQNLDSGDASIVSFVIIMPLFFAFLVTIIDVSIFFSNRTIISQLARNEAREVAIFGGAGTSSSQTPLEQSYASGGYDESCPSGISINKTPVECQLIASLGADTNTNNSVSTLPEQKSTGLVAATINSVSCGPASTNAVGETTSCNVNWTYRGIPGSFLTFIKIDGTAENLTGTAQSEVNLTGTALVPLAQYSGPTNDN